jgi:hypothetical protein
MTQYKIRRVFRHKGKLLGPGSIQELDPNHTEIATALKFRWLVAMDPVKQEAVDTQEKDTSSKEAKVTKAEKAPKVKKERKAKKNKGK